MNTAYYYDLIMSRLPSRQPGTITMFLPHDNVNDHSLREIHRMMTATGLRMQFQTVYTTQADLQYAAVAVCTNVIHPERDYLAVAFVTPRNFNAHAAGGFLRKNMVEVATDNGDLVRFFNTPSLSDWSEPIDMDYFPSGGPSESIAPKHKGSIGRLSERTMSLKINDDTANEDIVFKESVSCCERTPRSESTLATIPAELLEQLEESDLPLEYQKKEWIDRLTAMVLEYVVKFHEVPPMERINSIIRGRLQIGRSTLSPINVSGDMHIYLPTFNEIELRMTPLVRTVYILFLCHPEGIVLKDIADYREQLLEIYSMVKPGGDDEKARKNIDELCDPFSGSLNQKISRTREAVKRYVMVPDMAKSYMISGSKGKPYKIALDPNMISLPLSLRSLR